MIPMKHRPFARQPGVVASQPSVVQSQSGLLQGSLPTSKSAAVLQVAAAIAAAFGVTQDQALAAMECAAVIKANGWSVDDIQGAAGSLIAT